MGVIGADGKYYSGQPKLVELLPTGNSVWKQSDHDRQRREHKAELVEPYLRSGEPNPEFIELYPDLAQNVYKFIKSDEEISKEH